MTGISPDFIVISQLAKANNIKVKLILQNKLKVP